MLAGGRRVLDCFHIDTVLFLFLLDGGLILLQEERFRDNGLRFWKGTFGKQIISQTSQSKKDQTFCQKEHGFRVDSLYFLKTFRSNGNDTDGDHNRTGQR